MVLATGAVLSVAVAPASADLPGVTATYETASNYDDEAGGDADADDPAIWVNPTRPGASVVVGTLKNGGLTVVDLRGRELQHIATGEGGRFNNVDIVAGARIGGRTLDLAVVSDRGLDRLRIYAIDPRGAGAGAHVLTDVTTATPPRVFSATEAEIEEQRTAYGIAVRPDPAGGAPWVVASRRHETRVGLFRLAGDGAGRITYRQVDTVDLPAAFAVDGGTWAPCAEPGERPQVEGMVVDGDVVYAAQEDVGIWRIPLRWGLGRPELVQRVREFGRPAVFDEVTEECVFTGPESPSAGKYLTADAEGLTVAHTRFGKVLLASSQGDNTFAAFTPTRTGLVYRNGFTVGDGVLDGVRHSDGAAVTTKSLGPEFPHGLLVVHDGENTPSDRPDTNFKLVRWERVASVLG
ncbi:probable phytase [Alloactinosynnema sp. L-07]|nr:probable phytase [Alloactinosynnema sp. L-07]